MLRRRLPTRLADARSEEALLLRTGYLWAVRGSHPVLATTRERPR